VPLFRLAGRHAAVVFFCEAGRAPARVKLPFVLMVALWRSVARSSDHEVLKQVDQVKGVIQQVLGTKRLLQ
jgi:hypothetical protein